MKTSQCKKCEKRYRRLTKEDLCVFCYMKEFGKWPAEFSSGKQNPMKFGKTKKHGGKKKKKKK